MNSVTKLQALWRGYSGSKDDSEGRGEDSLAFREEYDDPGSQGLTPMTTQSRTESEL